jgi:hypothetical protein
MDEYVKKKRVIKEEKSRWESPNLQFALDDNRGGKTSVAEIKKKYYKNGELVNWDFEMNKFAPTSQVDAFKYRE